MAANQVIAVLALTVATQVCNAGGDPQPTKQLTQDQAFAIAERAFKKSGREYVNHYTVEPAVADPEDSKKNWGFFFRGTGEYLRPGYFVTVKVDKKTGKVKIIPGE